MSVFFFQAEDGIRDDLVTGVQTCALPIYQISDAILDACLTEDAYSRVACETLTATGLVVIAGEITTKTYVDFQKVVRGVVKSIGYDNALYGFDSNTCAVISSINKQSEAIAMAVHTA